MGKWLGCVKVPTASVPEGTMCAQELPFAQPTGIEGRLRMWDTMHSGDVWVTKPLAVARRIQMHRAGAWSTIVLSLKLAEAANAAEMQLSE